MKRHSDSPPPMDAQAAHLDRGWDLLKSNDFAGARISAKAALAAAPDEPDAMTLLGAIAAAEGDAEEALACFRKAMDADPEYPAPMLYAAEVLLDEGDDEALAEALELAEEAVDLAEDEDEYLDALLLQAEILIQLGEDERAAVALDHLPPVDLPDAGMHHRAARAYLDIDRADDAERHYQKALAADDDDADAYHGLGLVYEAREDHRNKVKAWLKTRELDLDDDEALPWAVSQDEFEKIAEEALAELPERIRELLSNVPIVASDYPSIEIVTEGNDPRMMGFFSGIPYPEKSNIAGVPPHLDCVFLYQKNIERQCRSRAEVLREIRITLLHETGHFFGLSEDELDEMGLG